MDDTLTVGDLFYVMSMGTHVEVCDGNEEVRWRGTVGMFPWSKTDLDVMQVDASGKDSFRIVTDSDRTAWD